MSRPRAQRIFNVPTELSSFVGRRHELAEIKRLLGRFRLVTLVGPGGVGKTRLALRAIATAERAYPDGIWLVELARLNDSGLLTREVATALGVRDQSSPSSLLALSRHIARKHLLLVLDNCEHVVDACGELVATLLRSCPRLQVLATSRQHLSVAGECSWRVPSLSLPPAADRPFDADEALRSEAVMLFADRAASLVQDFAVTESNARAVSELCQRLDGIPLAIELAAARLPALSVDQIAARMEDRFTLLTRGSRTEDPRHQTLRAALDWTYGLLTPQERLLWHRLAVFAGGFQLDAAETVCSDQVLRRETILDLMANLVEKSVVSPEHRDGRIRYRLLETIRGYGEERLIASGDELGMRRRHRDWYASLSEDAERHFGDAQQLDVFDSLSADHANLRSALQFCVSTAGEAAAGVVMAANLWLYWEARFHVSEGREWLAALLAIETSAGLARAKGLWAAGYLALLHSDVSTAVPMLIESRWLAEKWGDAKTLAYAVQFLGFAALYKGEAARSVELVEESLVLHRQAGNRPGAAGALLHLGLTRTFQGELETARGLYEQSLRISEAEGDRWIRSYALFGLGLALWLSADSRAAASRVKESLRLKHAIDDRSGIALCLAGLGWISAADAHASRAATLLGAAKSIWDALLVSTYDPWKTYDAACESRAREDLGAEAFEVAFRKGRALNIAQAVSYALEESSPARDHRVAASRHIETLTPREREVAALIARGLSDKEIAARLVISPRTAESHVRHIMDRLGFSARAQIGAWATGGAASKEAY